MVCAKKAQHRRAMDLRFHSKGMLFPFRLHDILEQAHTEGFQHIISWMPGGRSFRIHRPDKLLPILCRHGLKQRKWKSFLRQLQNYGFQRETSGPGSGTCHHELFVRGHKHLCLEMDRIKRSSSADSKKRVRETNEAVPSKVSSRSISCWKNTGPEKVPPDGWRIQGPSGIDGCAFRPLSARPRLAGYGSVLAPLGIELANTPREAFLDTIAGIDGVLGAQGGNSSPEPMDALFLNEASLEDTFERPSSNGLVPEDWGRVYWEGSRRRLPSLEFAY